MTVPRVLWIIYVIGCLLIMFMYALLHFYYKDKEDDPIPQDKLNLFIIIFLWPIIIPSALVIFMARRKNKE